MKFSYHVFPNCLEYIYKSWLQHNSYTFMLFDLMQTLMLKYLKQTVIKALVLWPLCKIHFLLMIFNNQFGKQI